MKRVSRSTGQIPPALGSSEGKPAEKSGVTDLYCEQHQKNVGSTFIKDIQSLPIKVCDICSGLLVVENTVGVRAHGPRSILTIRRVRTC